MLVKMGRVITLRNVLRDYLREQGLTLDNILDVMDEDPKGIIESLLRRINISEEEVYKLERNYTTRELNLLIFVIQVFYIANVSGYYKGYLIYPFRDKIIDEEGKITKDGLIEVIKSLGLKPRWVI